MKNDFDKIERKHKKLIDVAKNIMQKTGDPLHNYQHMIDVVNYTKELLEVGNGIEYNLGLDEEVCIISAYFHDVGRSVCGAGHEKVSCEMLTKEMTKLNYDKELISKCVDAIEFHKWSMNPKTNEGLVIKDADKIAWVGAKRWQECIEHNYPLKSIIELLPRLRNEILYFEFSRIIFDREMVKLVTLLHDEVFKSGNN